ncbi:MAG TPA: hypothetical protein VMF08_06725 [Candidatus Sulfotelmatobacter sp.]|nr:hypothetical protein [Candidatus Sulfotelmatobacter sp.]
MTTLAEYKNSIRSREDFVAFVRALSADLYDNPETWENGSLERFLAALAACVEDMDGNGKPAPQKPDWKAVADMLMEAKARNVEALV